MKKNMQTITAGLAGTVLCVSSVFALHSGLVGADDECIFTKEFIQDYETAQKSVEAVRECDEVLKHAGNTNSASLISERKQKLKALSEKKRQ